MLTSDIAMRSADQTALLAATRANPSRESADQGSMPFFHAIQEQLREGSGMTQAVLRLVSDLPTREEVFTHQQTIAHVSCHPNSSVSEDPKWHKKELEPIFKCRADTKAIDQSPTE